jgi:hypothetical protein
MGKSMIPGRCSERLDAMSKEDGVERWRKAKSMLNGRKVRLSAPSF